MKTGKASRFSLDLVIWNHWWLPKEKRDREETKEEEKITARVVVFARHVVLLDSLSRV